MRRLKCLWGNEGSKTSDNRLKVHLTVPFVGVQEPMYIESMVSKPRFKHVLFLVVPALVAAGALVGGGGATAGTAVFGVDYFISPPLVQGSYVTGPSETFDGFGDAPCPATIASGLIGVTGACKTLTQKDFGGAKPLASDSTPTVGEPGSDFASTDSGGTITFSMPETQRYLGFWWSAGSIGNTVKFYSGETEVLSLSTDDLTGLLGTMPADEAGYGTTGSITSLDGNSTYVKHHYFGNPRGVSGAGSPPVMTGALWAANTTNCQPSDCGVITSQPFVYLHVFGQGGLYFDRVTFSGPGFEFDNFVVSPLSQTPQGSLVPIGSLEGTPPPDFRPDGQAPEFDGPSLAHYQGQSDLPDTGGARTNLVWFAGVLMLGGIGSNRVMRRLRRS